MNPASKLFKELYLIHQLCGWRCLIEYVGQVVLNGVAIGRTKSLIPADRAMSGSVHNFKIFKESIALDGALIGGARELYGRKVYFALPGFALEPTDVVVDLGANAGVFTTLAARLSKKVIAVEAQSRFLDYISYNLQQNNCSDKASLEFGIVGGSTGLFSNEKRLESGSHFEKRPPVLSMNEIIKRHDLDNINFLKVDIEGSEFDLFFKDVDWLTRVEKIAMEVHPQFGNVRDLIAVLETNGFTVQLVDNNQKQTDTLGAGSGYLFAKRNAAQDAKITPAL
jgi:FkbM family methyltransferase